MSDVDLVVRDDAQAVADALAERLARAVADGGNIVLTGGSTPRLGYERAAAIAPDWRGVEIWWSDERCVPVEDERSNYGMAKAALLDRLEHPAAAVHRIRGELGREEAARLYDEELGNQALDFVVLGVGPDGHVASLFPGAPALHETGRRVVGAEAGHEPFVDRVTLTLPALRSAREILFLLTGGEKADAARRAFVQDPNTETPASLVRAETGRTIAILDRAAAAAIDP